MSGIRGYLFVNLSDTMHIMGLLWVLSKILSEKIIFSF